MFQGAVTAGLFEDFLLYKVLPYCTPGWPVIIMDNTSIHRSLLVPEICREAGVELEHLPPYSPDFNPIEKSFEVLKSWIKRFWMIAELFEDFSYFLQFAVEQSCFGVDGRSWFAIPRYGLNWG